MSAKSQASKYICQILATVISNRKNIATVIFSEHCRKWQKRKTKIKNLRNLTISLPNIYLFKGNNRNTRERCEICSKLTIKTLGRRQT